MYQKIIYTCNKYIDNLMTYSYNARPHQCRFNLGSTYSSSFF